MKRQPNILFCTHTSPSYMPAAELSTRQIVAGPNVTDKKSGMGRIMSIKTPREYDVAELVARLPADQKPELVVVLFDAFQNSVPRNLAKLTCRRLLYLADTHHGVAPLCTAFGYIQQEKFDRYAIAHDPHHLHWFIKLGVQPISVQLNISARDVVKPRFPTERKPTIFFVGQAAAVHAWRSKLLNRLSSENVPLQHLRIPANEAARHYDTHQLSLNTSNGDWTMRFFEVMSGGGCLLTDRLSEATGYAEHFKEGEDFIFFDDENDLVEKAKYYLARPELCMAIARSGHTKYKQYFSEEKRKQQFLEFAFSSDEMISQSAETHKFADSRCAEKSATPPIQSRILAYEQMQELQRADKIKRLEFSQSTPACVSTDMSDLMRLKSNISTDDSCLIVQENEAAILEQTPRYVYIMTDEQPTDTLLTMMQSKGYTQPTDLMMRHAGLFERQ